MNYEDYIARRIKNKKESSKSFRLFSLILLCLGIFLIVLPFLNLIEMENAMRYAGHGFGFITCLVPAYLQGQISKVKKDIIDLEFLKSRVDQVEDKLIEKALESL